MLILAAKVKHFWRSLDKKVVVNQRELILGVTACALAGVVTGMLISPKKTVSIGSHNASNNSGSFAPSATLATESGGEDSEET